MTIENAIYCLKADSELHSEICEECKLYGQTGTDHCYDDAVELAIKSLEAWEKVKAEIETNINNSTWSEVTNTLKWCGEIIDKHLKGVEE